MLIPPVNHALVVGEVYRSGHPIPLNFPFLDTLNLKTIVYIGTADDKFEEYDEWIAQNNIRVVRLPLKSVKEPFVDTDPRVVEEVVKLILDKRNHPILIHSDKGKHRVGVVMAVVRKCLQMWALAPIYEEYTRFAKGKAEPDFLFIEQFNPETLGVPEEFYPKWVHGYRAGPYVETKDNWLL